MDIYWQAELVDHSLLLYKRRPPNADFKASTFPTQIALAPGFLASEVQSHRLWEQISQQKMNVFRKLLDLMGFSLHPE